MPPDDHLESYLAERNEPCPQCGYNLRGLRTPQCPECGSELRLRVGLVEPRLALYIATLVACCVGLGGSILFSALVCVAAPGGPLWLLQNVSGYLLLMLLAGTAVTLPLLLIGRRWFRRWPLLVRVGVTVSMWFIVVVLSVLIVALFED